MDMYIAGEELILRTYTRDGAHGEGSRLGPPIDHVRCLQSVEVNQSTLWIDVPGRYRR